MANFIAQPGWALLGKAATTNPNSTGHVLPQLIMAGSQTLITPTRAPDNRGNAYFGPDALNLNTYRNGFFIPPNWDCNAAGGEHRHAEGDPACIVQGELTFKDQRGRFPRVLRSDFKGSRSSTR